MDTQERVKILHVIDSGGLYGAEVMLLNLMSEQTALGLVPILASIGDPGIVEKPLETEAMRRGLHVKAFRMRPGPNFIGAFDVMRFAWEEGVEILHSHGYKGNILFGFIPKMIRRMLIVSTVHGWTWTGGMTRMMIYEWLDSLTLARMDRVILVSSAMKEHPRLKNKSRIQFEVIANGIPADSFEDIGGEESKIAPGIVSFCRKGFIIGAVGRLSREKGFDTLLEAVANLVAVGNDIRLVLLGEGQLRWELETKVRALGLENIVIMPGYVRNARNYLPLFDLFAMPSLSEGLPIALLEAMLTGVPIIASRVGEVPVVLQEGRCGVLMEPGSVGTLVQGAKDIINNPDEAAQRAKIARQRVLENYSSRVMAERYLEVYKLAQSDQVD